MDYYASYSSTQSLAGHDEALHLRLAGDQFRSFIQPHLPSRREALILDIACGYGSYLKALAESGYTNAVGVDISREQIAYAREKLGLANAFEGDAFVFLKKYTADVDAILLLDILEHLSNDEVVEWLQQCNAALKPGGIVIIRVPNAMTPMQALFHGDFTHQRAYSPASMSQALRLAGFQDFRHLSSWDSPRRIVGLLRMLLWKALTPLLALAMKILCGTNAGGIFTANLLSIVRKPQT